MTLYPILVRIYAWLYEMQSIHMKFTEQRMQKTNDTNHYSFEKDELSSIVVPG